MGLLASTVKTAQLQSRWRITENVLDAPDADGKTVTSDQFNLGARTYSPTTTLVIEGLSAETYVLDGAGAATIDLTALLGTQANIDGTGEKVKAIRIHGRATNGALTISPGALNPYNLFGAGNSVIYPATNTLPWHIEFGDTLALVTDVSGVGSSQIDLAGTAGDEFDIEILLG